MHSSDAHIHFAIPSAHAALSADGVLHELMHSVCPETAALAHTQPMEVKAADLPIIQMVFDT